jgi:hypothetical protein
MKINSVRFAAATLIGIAAAVNGQVVKSASPPGLPLLKAGKQIEAGGKALTVGHTASPHVLDWNNDGKKDLLVGTFQDGKVMLFLNRGTDAAPEFDSGRALLAGGRAISVGFG